jgi:hypothetical protein
VLVPIGRAWPRIRRIAGAPVFSADGTTTAWNKNKTKVLHSHGPPARPG